MPRIVVAAALLFVSTMSAHGQALNDRSAPTCEINKAKRVWQRIERIDSPSGHWPISCKKGESVNAFVDYDAREVVVTAKAAALSEDRLAAMLGHERAHLALDGLAGPGYNAAIEAGADQLGLFYARLAGFSAAAGAAVYQDTGSQEMTGQELAEIGAWAKLVEAIGVKIDNSTPAMQQKKIAQIRDFFIETTREELNRQSAD